MSPFKVRLFESQKYGYETLASMSVLFSANQGTYDDVDQFRRSCITAIVLLF